MLLPRITPILGRRSSSNWSALACRTSRNQPPAFLAPSGLQVQAGELVFRGIIGFVQTHNRVEIPGCLFGVNFELHLAEPVEAFGKAGIEFNGPLERLGCLL